MSSYHFIGVDVAKEKFDVSLFKEGEFLEEVFHQNASGFEEFLTWVNKHASCAWVCMEATGYYSERLADFLNVQGVRVSVVNPVQIKYFAKVKLSRNKNDKVDARMIAAYCEALLPRLFTPRSEQQKYIRELIQLEDTLRGQRSQLKLQLSCVQSKGIKKQFEKTIKMLDKRLKELEVEIRLRVEGDEKFQAVVKLVESIIELLLIIPIIYTIKIKRIHSIQ